MAVTTSSKLLFIKTISAASMAMSVPAPIAIPTSAATSAGESFIPSPTIATMLPAACKKMSQGLASATTVSIPTCLAMALAVPRFQRVRNRENPMQLPIDGHENRSLSKPFSFC